MSKEDKSHLLKDQTHEIVEQERKKLESGFFGFWVRQWRATFMLTAIIIVMGIMALIQIPKESMPEIEIGMVSVTTIYPGASATDVDNLITEKIEAEVKDLKGVKKVTSTSRTSVSSVLLELGDDADFTDTLANIKDAVDKVILPADAEEPMVVNAALPQEQLFELMIYAPDDTYSLDFLRGRASEIKAYLEGKGVISTILVGGGSDYDLEVLVDKAKIEELGMSLYQISNVIKSYNATQPLGSHEVGEYVYDFRYDGELRSATDVGNIPLLLPKGGTLYLKDIAQIQPKHSDESIQQVGFYEQTGNNYVSMMVNKKSGISILQGSREAKEQIADLLETQEFAGVSYLYVNDIGEMISEDYDSLASNGLETVIIVFLLMLLFVGLKEAFLGTISVPLAFCITFYVLNAMDLSLNFLTNCSLIISFGIAIDATIVVIQGAHERIRQGYNPKSAVLLAVNDYKIPLISGTATTLVVFLPMMVLPGVVGRFLAYIPITIFVTLLASLFVALTINSALYYKLSSPKKVYEDDVEDAEFMPESEKILLEDERQGKTLATEDQKSGGGMRDKLLDKITGFYTFCLAWVVKSPKTRVISILSPLVLMVLSFVFLSPQIGFNLFPSMDTGYISITITGKDGLSQDVMAQKVESVDAVVSQIPELANYYYTINDNILTLNMDVGLKDTRERTSFEIGDQLLEDLSYLVVEGLDVQSVVQSMGPSSSSKPVGIKLIAESNKDFDTLVSVAREFEVYLKSLPGTKNVSLSAQETPGEFVFVFDEDRLTSLGIRPTDLLSEMYFVTNGAGAGTMKGEYSDIDLKVKYSEYQDHMDPSDVQSLVVSTLAGPVTVGTVSEYEVTNAVKTLSRENNKIVVSVESDLDLGEDSTSFNQALVSFAQTYAFPDGISYQAGGEAQENSDLLLALLSAFIISVFLIFGILVLQFNSYLQPMIVMYSVIMGLFGMNVGLWLTGNPYTVVVMIGFIALTGIVVNNAIILIDRSNIGVARGKDLKDAVMETGKSRLRPILSTTFATVLGLSTVATDDFFSGLAYTIIFGLTIATLMTLFVIPAIYCDQQKVMNLVKRSFISWLLIFGLPVLAVGVFVLLGLGWGVSLFDQSWFLPLVGILSLLYLLFYAGYSIWVKTTSRGQTFVEKLLGMNVRLLSGKEMTMSISLKRFCFLWGLLLLPFIFGGICWLVFGATIGGIVMIVGAIIYVLGNLYSFWVSEKDQMWHDKLAGTYLYVEPKEKE